MRESIRRSILYNSPGPSVDGIYGPELFKRSILISNAAVTDLGNGIYSCSGAQNPSIVDVYAPDQTQPAGKVYRVTFDIISASVSGIRALANSTNSVAISSTAGKYTIDVTDTTNGGKFGIRCAITFAGVFGNISVREIL